MSANKLKHAENRKPQFSDSRKLLRVPVVPRIPLIEDLTKEPIPPGSNILVEFDPSSQWYDTLAMIATGWLHNGGNVSYNLLAQSPDSTRSRLSRLGVEFAKLELVDRLRIHDYYTSTLGKKPAERLAHNSLKIAEVSIEFLKTQMNGPPIPHILRVVDNVSVWARFNDERSWIEFFLTRGLPLAPLTKSTNIAGIIRDLHSDSVYKQLEDANDGIIDLRLDETGEVVKNLIRIRKMQNVSFDSRWHALKIGENFEVTLEK
jgi:KaiC/GvpD/RAD55 family RecA-like ATPase